MKWKIGIVAAVVALAAAQLIFGGRKDAAVPVAGSTAAVETVAAVPTPASAPALPAPGDITAIEIGDDRVTLRKTETGWTVSQLGGAPASATKIDAFLAALLAGNFSPVPPATEPDATGLAGDVGVRVTLIAKPMPPEVWIFDIGLHPEGDFNAAYVRMPDNMDADTPDGELFLVDSDLRAELGLWDNTRGGTPDPLVWLDTRVLQFDPGQVVSLTATYPDHEIIFAKQAGEGENAEPAWTLLSPAPGGSWSEDGLRRWLADLADFRIAGIADVADMEAKGGQGHSIVLGFADGSEKSLRVVPSHAGESAVAVVSDVPERAFVLPDWRFEKYFQRLDSLFPEAVPKYALSDVRLLDVRHGGESVKIMRRDGGWEALALPYPAKTEVVERLARVFSAWRPEDYADTGAKTPRPAYGGPTVEIVLADGGVHQYRLAGRHPAFLRRYVALDGARVLSVTDAEAGVMFPEFADILELGPVFPELDGETIDSFGVESIAGDFRVRIARNDAGEWTAESGAKTMPLVAAEAEALAAELRAWRVGGFYPSGQPAAGEENYRVTVGTGAGETGITLFPPVDRAVPYVTEGLEYFRLDHTAFRNWLFVVRDVGRRVDGYAEPVEESVTEEIPDAGPAVDAAEAAVPTSPAPQKIVPEDVEYSGTVRGKAAAAEPAPVP
jgi:hypothetical protein